MSASPFGEIAGTVTDPAGDAIAGAKVTARNGSDAHGVTTDVDGRYVIAGLRAGTYSVSIGGASGFQPQEGDGIELVAGSSVAVNMMLAVGVPDVGTKVIARVRRREAPPKTVALRANLLPSPPSPPPQPLSVVQQVTAWVNGLASGAIRYHVDRGMRLNGQYTASAVLYPPGVERAADAAGGARGSPSANGGTASGENAAGTFKQATYMRMDLTQDDNPGTFEIEPRQGECRLVPMDRPTGWTFQVTPLEEGKVKTLKFAAYAIPGAEASACVPDNPASIALPVVKETVHVAAFTLQSPGVAAWDSFWVSSWKWLLLILPAAAMLARFGGLEEWWKRRRRPGPQPSSSASPGRGS